MKKIYLLFIIVISILVTSCSKDVFKSYEERIIGTWRITDVDRRSIGGNISNLPFTSGSFTFKEDRTLTYTDVNNVVHSGSWRLVIKFVEDERVQTLQITTVDFSNQQVRTEYYEDLNFMGTNYFRAITSAGIHSFVTHFRR